MTYNMRENEWFPEVEISRERITDMHKLATRWANEDEFCVYLKEKLEGVTIRHFKGDERTAIVDIQYNKVAEEGTKKRPDFRITLADDIEELSNPFLIEVKYIPLSQLGAFKIPLKALKQMTEYRYLYKEKLDILLLTNHSWLIGPTLAGHGAVNLLDGGWSEYTFRRTLWHLKFGRVMRGRYNDTEYKVLEFNHAVSDNRVFLMDL